MPSSSGMFDEFVKAKLNVWKYTRYLDVGCGAGKYGRMIRAVVPESHIAGIEVDNDYIERFGLRQVYDEVLNGSVQTFLNGSQAISYDLIIFGDVIEHLLKSDGVNVLHFFVYRCKRMLVVYPSKYIQYDVDGKAHESHRSVWGPQDFSHFECDHTTSGYMNVAIIRGYLDDKRAVYWDNGQTRASG